MKHIWLFFCSMWLINSMSLTSHVIRSKENGTLYYGEDHEANESSSNDNSNKNHHDNFNESLSNENSDESLSNDNSKVSLSKDNYDISLCHDNFDEKSNDCIPRFMRKLFNDSVEDDKVTIVKKHRRNRNKFPKRRERKYFNRTPQKQNLQNSKQEDKVKIESSTTNISKNKMIGESLTIKPIASKDNVKTELSTIKPVALEDKVTTKSPTEKNKPKDEEAKESSKIEVIDSGAKNTSAPNTIGSPEENSTEEANISSGETLQYYTTSILIPPILYILLLL